MVRVGKGFWKTLYSEEVEVGEWKKESGKRKVEERKWKAMGLSTSVCSLHVVGGQ
jgi:hypothetical protein